MPVRSTHIVNPSSTSDLTKAVFAGRGVDDLVERAHPWLAHAGFAPSMTGAPSGTGT